MKDKRIEEQYRKWAETYDKDKIRLLEKQGTNYEEFMRRFIDLCDLKQEMNILDVGTGTGLTSIAIAKALSCKCKIFAIEPVEEMIGKAKRNIQQEGVEECIHIRRGVGESLPCNDENFDLITCTFAIRHMDVMKAISEFKRVLKRDGKIVVADICAPEKWRSIPGRIITPFMQFMVSRKYKGEMKSKVLTVEEWKTLLKKSGLTLDKIIEFPGKREPHWELKRVIISMRKIG
ncbi:MAG TPA: class I SAM-dependent methyltransferase [Thermoplasmatales archaeon]|nr:class I SAM-dependent methyltransferase [Thermoplasmatales archaeon]